MAISLKSISKTKHASPPRILIHGPEKVGKSTFFAGGLISIGGTPSQHDSAPNPIYIRTEDGLNGIDTSAFELAESYQDVIDALTALAREEHEFGTVVLDSADWLERLIHTKVCADDGVNSIEAAGGGYGKGYQVALSYWQEVLKALDYLNKSKGMVVGVICHSVVVPFNDPIHEPYDRYEMKLHQPKKQTGARDMLLEWADVVGFAQREIFVSKKDVATGAKAGKDAPKVARGVDSGGCNKLHLIGSPAFVAGNRYGLPATIDLNWQSFADAMTASTNRNNSGE
jgi:hypothetical protein